MFILKGKQQLEKAIERAKQIRPRVEFDCFGRYRVSGSKGGFYTVICKKSENNYKTVECTCKGGESGLVCYHAAAALSLHIGIARQRQTA
ncbi:MAG: SWIM zinc finger family protein [Acidobacteriota bacterium]|nr:SWIM zinc finger family protein [Acidobacteriota bacterium]